MECSREAMEEMGSNGVEAVKWSGGEYGIEKGIFGVENREKALELS